NIELPSTSLRLGQIAEEAVVVAYRHASTHAEIERLARQLAQVSVTVLGGLLLSRRTGLRGQLRRGRNDGRSRRPATGSTGHREVARSQPRAEAPDFTKPTPAVSEPAHPWDSGAVATSATPADASVVDAPSAYSARFGGSDSTPPGVTRSASARKS
ncbi:MAG: hypothetical protein ABI047_12055, partial [Jatrophihabitantaceae bacterium]